MKRGGEWQREDNENVGFVPPLLEGGTRLRRAGRIIVISILYM